jgi:hypothetical protein
VRVAPSIRTGAHPGKRRKTVFTYDEVFWLNVTNLVLGLVTLACIIVIGYAALKELRERARARATERVEADDHAFVISGLGITMADGGEKLGDDEMLVVTEDGIESVPKLADEKKKRDPGK